MLIFDKTITQSKVDKKKRRNELHQDSKRIKLDISNVERSLDRTG